MKPSYSNFFWPLAVALIISAFLAGAASAGNGSQAANPGALAGYWMRLDGGYLLQLSHIADGGAVQAAYYNPRPINVAKAEWRQKGDELEVFVELRDVNYPGSTYTLSYDSATDKLRGVYFQAMERQYFEVVFVRSEVETEGGKQR